MIQNISGATICTICSHLGLTHAAGFFCVAKDCQCGHHKDDPVHQQSCVACIKSKEAPKPVDPPVARPVEERVFDPDFNGA